VLGEVEAEAAVDGLAVGGGLHDRDVMVSVAEAGPTRQEKRRPVEVSSRTVSAMRAGAVAGVKRAAATMSKVSSFRPLSAMTRSPVSRTVAPGRLRCR
jgi:hypothetical protein